jgi:hypothetical protein
MKLHLRVSRVKRVEKNDKLIIDAEKRVQVKQVIYIEKITFKDHD